MRIELSLIYGLLEVLILKRNWVVFQIQYPIDSFDLRLLYPSSTLTLCLSPFSLSYFVFFYDFSITGSQKGFIILYD